MITLFSSLLSCAGIACSATIIQHLYLPKEGVRPAEYRVKVERSVTMHTRDSIALVADVYHPVSREPQPTILVRIPFTGTFGNRLRADAIARFWASRGYHVVIQGSRGRYKSGGSYYPLVSERDDGIDTLAWLAKQPWFDGRLGMWGGSTFGYTQWVIADQEAPGPQALAIQIASTNFHRMFYPGGAFSLESALFWAVRSHGTRDRDPRPSDLERGYAGFPMIEADDRAMRDVPFFNDWVNHSERDEYWEAIDGTDRARTLKAPVLLMAGWYDAFLPTQLADYLDIQMNAKRDIAANTQLVIGPWAHAETVIMPGAASPGDYRQSVLAPSISWFDRHLRGSADEVGSGAPVLLYVMGDNIWRPEQEWPLARAIETPYYLTSDGGANTANGDGMLSAIPPAKDKHPDTYIYDPRKPVPSRGGTMLGPRAGVASQNEIEARDDVLVYTSPVLAKDLEVTGPVRAVLHVETSAPSTDFVVRLVDVHPDGSAYNVTDGILRKPFPVSERDASHPTEIMIDLWPTSMVFKAGHRVRVDISSSSYPRYDRNPNTGYAAARETAPVIATQKVYHGPRSPSRILLPIVPRVPDECAGTFPVTPGGNSGVVDCSRSTVH